MEPTDTTIEAPAPAPIERLGFIKVPVRRCAGTTKAGNPCGAPAVGGHDLCRNHLGRSPKFTHEDGVYGSQVAATKRRNRNNVLQILKERNPKRLLDVLEEGLTATKWRSVDGERVPTSEPDWDVRLACAKELLDRTVGKAPKTIEHTGDGGGPITVATFHAAVNAIESGDPKALEAYYEDAEVVDDDHPPA